GHSRFAFALEPAAQRIRLLEVAANFFQSARLGVSRRKRQDAFDRLAHLVTELKCNAGLRLLLATLEFEAQLDKEQLLKDHADVGRGAKGLQVLHALAFVGPVHVSDCFTWGNQVQALANGSRNRLRQFRREVFERSMNDPAEPTRGQPSLPGGLVNWNNAADFQRLGNILLGFLLTFANDFELRLP